MREITFKIDRIIRSNRKTISIRVTDEGEVEVRAPLNMSEENIFKIVKEKEDWIKRKIEEVNSRDPHYKEKEFVNGEGFLYLGKSYRLKIVEDQETPLKLQGYFLLSKKYLPYAREIFINWYKQKAYDKIKERVEFYSKITGLKYNKVNITNAQKRWGSCSPNGNLNFSWRLIMAPISVIDYVVVHELVHTKIKNHTREFWSSVKVILPDYKKDEEWLKENGYLLRL